MQALKELLFSISATNMVDIVIMACLIYFVLAWLQATRAFQILATLLGIGLFYFVASGLGLVLTSVLFQYLGAAIIVVLVIVFQPEIREMLERASPVRYLRGRQANDLGSDIIEETLKAVAELARQRLGALIVFRQRDRLDNLVLTGKALDSLVSAEAMVMIFQKTSPLHDGAVMIHRNRIKAAGCILPLSTNEDLSSRFGTRHRAALGLAEKSDAVCIVVSEERGEVSLVAGKEIRAYQKKGEFRRALEHATQHSHDLLEGSPPSVFTVIRSNWQLKLLSLATAMLAWFVIVGPQRSEVGVSVPIQYTDLPPGMEITGKWMDRIDVRVRGSESGLANLKPGSIRAVVNLSHVVTGLNFFRITNQNLSVPPGIKISQIRPSDLSLNIEAASMKKLNVVPTIVGAIPEKVKIVVTPSEIRVRALQAELAKVKSATTEPVKVAELATKGKVVVPVIVKPEGVSIETVEPLQVTVSLQVEQQ